jgi:16S rRNA processing protein RimM
MRVVGKVIEAHGLRGDLYVFIFSGDTSWAGDLEGVELRLTPESKTGQSFKIIKTKPHKKGLILTLDSLTDRTAAENWEKTFLFVPEDTFVSEEGEVPFLTEFEGFHIFNGELDLGPIQGFRDNGAYDLFVVKFQGREHEIPFVEAFIVKIDKASKQIRMQLPEGLLEINT